LKKIVFILFISNLVSCSSNYKKPEAFSAKIKRFSPLEEYINTVPSSAPLSENIRFSRRPASLETKRKQKVFGSNKSLYFLTIFDQFQTLKSYSKLVLPSIESCPYFHNSLTLRKNKLSLNKRKKNINFYFLNKSHLINADFLSSAPELYLPMTGQNQKPRVIDILKKQEKEQWDHTIKKAISFHTLKIFREISQLCFKGKSTNYYNYQNLITFIKKEKNFKPSKNNLKILLKTTLFSNMALISSLRKKAKGRNLASMDREERELGNQVLYRFKATWAQDYFDKIKKK
jgi:hypothetical protein